MEWFELLNEVFSWIPDPVEEFIEAKLPFDNGDGQLTVNDFDPTKNNYISPGDGRIYSAYDQLNKTGKKVVSELFEATNPNVADDVVRNIDDVARIFGKIIP
ncbi:hypothetical protein A6S26_34590 [Nostoc sp. ATCC 43529]|nr:hypothetical protein A6S26_34590 [Nostoc sp. ATCC 43529]